MKRKLKKIALYFGKRHGGMSSYMLSNTLKALEGKDSLIIVDPKGEFKEKLKEFGGVQ